MVLRLICLLLFGCASEEKPRVVSEETYPSEYAEAICDVQIECGLMDDLDACQSDIESRWEDKLSLGCFDESAARDCLDTLEALTCSGYEAGESSMCADVDECE